MIHLSRRAALLAAVAIASPLAARAAALPRGTLHRRPGCECCEGYARYLHENGIEVDVITTDRLAEMSLAAGIPGPLEGCHLAAIDGYYVSGHVPIEAVKKLLANRPALVAITVPGMPEGSPGMSGTLEGRLVVQAIPKDGSAPSVFVY